MKENSREVRRIMVKSLFPQGVPQLWCPTLTHFSSAGVVDEGRTEAHLDHLRHHVRGILVPGTTGEGWEMKDDETRRLLEIILPLASQGKFQVLIGVLKTDIESTRQTILDTIAWLKKRADESDYLSALKASHVTGFTICPPKGKTLSQSDIRNGLSSVLELGFPTSVYQLPQVTENEMSPATVQRLAEEHPNFYLFKDSSGRDEIAKSGLDFGSMFLVRGAEGDYAKWTSGAGGPYDGLLLSMANCFAKELAEVLELLQFGRREEAAQLSDRLTGAANEIFSVVEGFPEGNPYTNANKALDQIYAYDSAAEKADAPLLYSGTKLPLKFIKSASEILNKYNLYPIKGYL